MERAVQLEGAADAEACKDGFATVTFEDLQGDQRENGKGEIFRVLWPILRISSFTLTKLRTIGDFEERRDEILRKGVMRFNFQ